MSEIQKEHAEMTAHLDESVIPALDLSYFERENIINGGVIIRTEQLEDVTTMISNMLRVERGSGDAPCLMVTSQSNYGKTTIYNSILGSNKKWTKSIRFMSLLPTTEKIKPIPKIIRALGMKPGRDGLDESVLANFCMTNNIRAIAIDEFQCLMQQSKKDQLDFLTFLRFLCDKPLYLSIFVFGLADTHQAIQLEGSTARRFEMYELLKWSRVDPEYLSFLRTYESTLPLKQASNLASNEIASWLYENSDGGVIGKIVTLIKSAAKWAISCGEEKITLEMLKNALEKPWLQKRPDEEDE